MSDPMTDERALSSLPSLLARLNDGERNERHYTYKDTVYWLRQWRTLAKDAIAVLQQREAAQEPVAEVTGGGYMERSIVWLEAAADLPAGVHKLYTAPTNPPEIGSKPVVEPTADHWRRALWDINFKSFNDDEWLTITQRAREIAQEGE